MRCVFFTVLLLPSSPAPALFLFFTFIIIAQRWVWIVKVSCSHKTPWLGVLVKFLSLGTQRKNFFLFHPPLLSVISCPAHGKTSYSANPRIRKFVFKVHVSMSRFHQLLSYLFFTSPSPAWWIKLDQSREYRKEGVRRKMSSLLAPHPTPAFQLTLESFYGEGKARSNPFVF